jgi:hypothetical protein
MDTYYFGDYLKRQEVYKYHEASEVIQLTSRGVENESYKQALRTISDLIEIAYGRYQSVLTKGEHQNDR